VSTNQNQDNAKITAASHSIRIRAALPFPFLLLETGDKILQETGGEINLEQAA